MPPRIYLVQCPCTALRRPTPVASQASISIASFVRLVALAARPARASCVPTWAPAARGAHARRASTTLTRPTADPTTTTPRPAARWLVAAPLLRRPGALDLTARPSHGRLSSARRLCVARYGLNLLTASRPATAASSRAVERWRRDRSRSVGTRPSLPSRPIRRRSRARPKYVMRPE